MNIQKFSYLKHQLSEERKKIEKHRVRSLYSGMEKNTSILLNVVKTEGLKWV